MKFKPLIVSACLVFVPLGVTAAPSTGDKLFTLAGSGSSDKDLDNNQFNVSFDVGQYMTDQTAVGIRQSAGAADLGDDSSWTGATRVFADYHFGRADMQPFLGANIGGIYGDGVDETFFAGPEFGLKYYMKRETYLSVQAEYQVFFDNSNDVENNYDNGAFVYSAGLGINF
ncbi:hypothetical protein [Hydrocarboniclastica marina]|uniref:Outer membrane protein beta-barrel domain-containing protein n=1 Tax=Hydrocarboniclastica marina TaxID=2259620 RepID=A0A4P7XFP3_9ALTE|nr:hypothetical protein [Hydrocarboniclastica marina]MAL98461.1 hypothetical protein [Alteromonadaceae bacterium]QCF25781.1 hypothetical protein soil367_07535 [Hydrocarboniclastica marina]|tara:strand:- start:2613 stop:3125 length:513 start_codon:yes stop_codon:yes gene_type:complete